MLKAFKLIQKEIAFTYLIIIGEGEEKDFYLNYIEKNELKCKIFDPTDNITEFYKTIDILVLPSRVHPFPLVMLEAGLFEEIFIGSKVDGIAEFIDDGYDGFLFDLEIFLN